MASVASELMAGSPKTARVRASRSGQTDGTRPAFSWADCTRNRRARSLATVVFRDLQLDTHSCSKHSEPSRMPGCRRRQRAHRDRAVLQPSAAPQGSRHHRQRRTVRLGMERREEHRGRPDQNQERLTARSEISSRQREAERPFDALVIASVTGKRPGRGQRGCGDQNGAGEVRQPALEVRTARNRRGRLAIHERPASNHR